jgi:hypothetical protein
MNDEPKIRLSKELADIIDRYRESLTREEFIDLCVRTFLRDQGSIIPETEKIEQVKEQKIPKREVPVKEEAREVHVREERVDRGTYAPLTVQHGPLVQRGVRETAQTVPRTQAREFPGAQYINDTKFIVLWLAAIGFYGLGDLVTTHYALQLGLVEANPIAAIFKNIINMALFKIATIIAAFLISYTVFNTKTLIYSAPAMMLIAGLVLTVNNILKIDHVI